MSDYSSYLQKANYNFNNPNADIEANTSSSNQQQTSAVRNVFNSVLNKVKGYAKLNTSEADNQQKVDIVQQNTQKTCLQKAISYCEVEKSYKYFFLFLTIGLGLLMMSIFFLPTAILAPRKFVSLFSLGAIVTIISFIFYYGTQSFIEMLFTKERRLYTISFLISTVIGTYLSCLNTWFVLSLLCSLVQLFVLIIFLLSFIPGGKAGINFMVNMILSPVKRLFQRN